MSHEKKLPERIIHYVKANPQCTVEEIAKGVGDTRGNTSSRLTVMLRKEARLRREERINAIKRPYYIYWWDEQAKIPMGEKKTPRTKKKSQSALVSESSNDQTENSIRIVQKSAEEVQVSKKTALQQEELVDTLHERQQLLETHAKEYQFSGASNVLMGSMLESMVEKIHVLAKGMVAVVGPLIQQEVSKGLQKEMEKAIAQTVANIPVMQQDIEMKLHQAIINEKKKKISIAGLMPAQQEDIKKEFGDCFRFTFISNDANQARGRDAAKNSDLVITMIHHMSHSQCEVLKAANKNYIQISGGMSKLRETLTNFYLDVK